jgi:hypothetical protein
VLGRCGEVCLRASLMRRRTPSLVAHSPWTLREKATRDSLAARALQLHSWNALDSEGLAVGRELCLPASAASVGQVELVRRHVRMGSVWVLLWCAPVMCVCAKAEARDFLRVAAPVHSVVFSTQKCTPERPSRPVCRATSTVAISVKWSTDPAARITEATVLCTSSRRRKGGVVVADLWRRVDGAFVQAGRWARRRCSAAGC